MCSARSPENYSVVSKYTNSGRDSNGNDHSSNYSRNERKKERSRSRSRDRGRDKKKKRDRSRDRDRERDHDRKREKDRSSRDRERDRERDRDVDRERDRERRKREERERDRDRDHDRDRDRDSHSRRSRSRTHDSYDSRRRRRKERSRSYNNDNENEDHESNRRSSSREKVERNHLEPVKEEIRETRFDLTQTIQELMGATVATKNFAAFFNCGNSNDSVSNGPSENSQDGTERKRRKKSRWGGTENDKTFIPGMPTILPSSLDPTQQEAYLVQLQIEEISRKLRTGELGIPQNPEERSPSPEPIYSSDGKRLNTREFRYRKKLEEQRHQLIQKMQSVNPEFKPPADYKPPVTRVIDKVLIPQEEHPDINFVGLLIGPRGNTLKAMEKETGAKIIIRGKGSVKEGKVGRKDGQPLAGEDEPLHAFITASNPEAVKRAVDKIKDVIRQGIEVPEGHNDLRRMQLRELAQLNGTLRETDCPRCTNCGSTEHKSWLCPDKPNVTNSIVCTACGGAGHISKDCRSKRPGAAVGETTENVQAKIDEEYMSLMAELGEGPPPPSQQKQSNDPLAQVHINRGYNIFDKKPATMQAIQAPPPPIPSGAPPIVPGGMMTVAPPPPVPPGWNQSNSGAAVSVMPPPPNTQPPPTPAPPIMPWMSAIQPPPPGGDPPPPPGTSPLLPPGTIAPPMPPLIPPPPGTAPMPTAPLPPWPMPSTYPAWGAPPGVYAPPPPPPPCTPPPPGIAGLAQLPPPPPPSV